MRTFWNMPVLALMVALLAGCVTVNIYFPAAAAEEAARAIVRDALQVPDAESAPGGAPESEPEASLAAPVARSASADAMPPLLARLLEGLVGPAAAASPDIEIETPAINQIRTSMRQRSSQLAPHFRSGAIGFGNNADVVIRDLSDVPLRERGKVQRLVREENADRDALYREIARANNRPDWEPRIRETFARVWVEEAPSGYWYQDGDGRWRQK